MRRAGRLCSFAALIVAGLAAAASAAPVNDAVLLSNRRIWNSAPHNAFTDLELFNGQMYVTFREASRHTVPDEGLQGGDVRVIRSANRGQSWSSVGLFDFGVNNDLRDPKLNVTPDNRLTLLATNQPHQSGVSRRSYVWSSSDGATWSTPTSVGELGRWMWRTEWDGDTAYGISYQGGVTRLHASDDGLNYVTRVATLTTGSSNEAGLLFRDDGSAVALVRREDNTAVVGTSAGADHSSWTWRSTNLFVGGPDIIELPDGRIIAAGRFKTGGSDHTSIAALEPATGEMTELLTLPSGGDTGYAGLLWHEGTLWVSYYSSHQGRSSIYLANVAFASIPEPGGVAAIGMCGIGLMRRPQTFIQDRKSVG